VRTVCEALEALHHSHWDGMDLASTLAEVPRVELKPSDLPPPRTELLQQQHLRQQPSATGPPLPQPQPQQQQQHPQRPRSQSVDTPPQRASRSVPHLSSWTGGLSAGASLSHHEMLAAAHRLLREAHEAHETHRAAQQWQQWQALGEGAAVGRGGDGKDGQGLVFTGSAVGVGETEGEHTEASLPSLSRIATPAPPIAMAGLAPLPPSLTHEGHHQRHGGGPLLLESVVRKLQGARDTLTQLLDVASQPLPHGGLHGHIVLGLCNEAAPSPEAFVQVRRCGGSEVLESPHNHVSHQQTK
jgi:hypothetical protein